MGRTRVYRDLTASPSAKSSPGRVRWTRRASKLMRETRRSGNDPRFAGSRGTDGATRRRPRPDAGSRGHLQGHVQGVFVEPERVPEPEGVDPAVLSLPALPGQEF